MERLMIQVSFPDIQAAVDCVVNILQASLPVARLELLDEVQVRASNNYSNLSYRETPHLFLGNTLPSEPQ